MNSGRAARRRHPVILRAFAALEKTGMVMPIELAVLRHTGVSMVTWVTRCGRGLPYIPTLVLTTVGSRTGHLRDVALGFYIRDGNVLLVASVGGAARNPAWYVNLRAHPLAWITVNRQRVAVDTRTATDGERDELWSYIKSRVPEYTAYEVRAAPAREIPVVIATPRSALALGA